MKHRLYLLCIFATLAVCCPQALKSEPIYGLPDSLSSEAIVSILVAEPSPDEVYTLYGHAGLRVQDREQAIDLTFNYGIFNFDDGFLLRFVPGRTDYIVQPQLSQDYIHSYLSRGSQVRELILEMDNEARQEAWHYLMHNIQPENRVYRYNFFYDNCSTRPVQIFAEALRRSGERTGKARILTLPKRPEQSTTWRKQINHLEQKHPWVVLGTDLALGAPTDEAMSARDLLFLPHHIEHVLRSGIIKGEHKASPIRATRLYEAYGDASQGSSWLRWLYHPTLIFTLVLIGSLIAFVRMLLGHSIWRALEIALWSLGGLAGLILWYIALGTEHPKVWPNYNLIVLHPALWLGGISPLVRPRWQGLRLSFHFLNFAGQIGFLLLSWALPQHFNSAVYMLAASLALLSLGRLLEYRRRRLQIQ